MNREQRILIFTLTLMCGFVIAGAVEAFMGSSRRLSLTFTFIGLALLFAHLGHVWLKRHPRTKK